MLIDSLRQPTLDLRSAIPAPWEGFAPMHAAALNHGALPARIKEFVALAISVATQRDRCIAHHAKAATRRGATSEEAAETRWVAMHMDGDRASIYAPIARAASEELSTHTASG